MASLYQVRISLFHFKNNLPISPVDGGSSWYPGVKETLGHVRMRTFILISTINATKSKLQWGYRPECLPLPQP